MGEKIFHLEENPFCHTLPKTARIGSTQSIDTQLYAAETVRSMMAFRFLVRRPQRFDHVQFVRQTVASNDVALFTGEKTAQHSHPHLFSSLSDKTDTDPPSARFERSGERFLGGPICALIRFFPYFPRRPGVDEMALLTARFFKLQSNNRLFTSREWILNFK